MLLLSKIYLILRSLWVAVRGLEEFSDPHDYPLDDIIHRALRGRGSIYPFGMLYRYGAVTLGSPSSIRNWGLGTVFLIPPAFVPGRLKKAAEVFREPIYVDVDLSAELGGFKVSMPMAVGSMGSTAIAGKTSIPIAKAAARHGIVMSVGENVATVRGYEKRYSKTHPSWKERAMAYLREIDSRGQDLGGLIVQQSVEDAYNELWNRVYTDKDLDHYIDRGLIGFEVKIGQGAKPGLGGIIKLPKEEAEKLTRKYNIDFLEGKYAVRYSVPSTYTENILRSLIRNMKTQYPRVRIWVKVGPFRDVLRVIGIAAEEGAHAVVIDSREGGTGMAPTVSMRHFGYPTLTSALAIFEARRRGIAIDMLLGGRVYDGGDMVKARALGASGIYSARPLVLSALVRGEKGVHNFLESVAVEAKMAVSALGKYRIDEVSHDDIAVIDPHIAKLYGLRYIHEIPLTDR